VHTTVKTKKNRREKEEDSFTSSSEEDEKPKKHRMRKVVEYQVTQVISKASGLNLVSLPVKETRRGQTNFLLDSGATLTLIKIGKLKGDTQVRKEKMTLTGVTGHKIHTLGKIRATVIVR